MNRQRPRQTEVTEPAAALISYLDELLQTATSAVAETDPPEPGPALPVEEPRAEVRQVAEPVEEAAPAVTEGKAVVPPPAEPEGRPEWAEQPFECLIFRVAGLQLAVPLVLLGAIHRIDDRIKPIPGRPPWYMGILPDRGQNLKVVDTAEWIMAGRVPDQAAEGYRFVIRLDNSDWALACDEVAQSFTLSPDEVRWRSARSKRPWLAGTVIQHMCALIDVGAMAKLLARAEKEHRLELD